MRWENIFVDNNLFSEVCEERIFENIIFSGSPPACPLHGLRDELNNEEDDRVCDENQDQGVEELHQDHGRGAANPDGVSS